MVEKKTLTVKEGENVTLNCEIDSKPAAVYHNWTKDDDVVSTDLKHVLGNVQRYDAGIYTCIAVNELYDGTLGTGYNETKVIVEYIPDVNIDIEAPIIKEGETAMFTCKIDSNPNVTYHNWTNDGVVVSTDLNLAIANAQRQHTGTYQCIAGNVFYDGTTGTGSNATELTVQYTPSVSVDKRRVSVREGENVTFSCEIDSNTDVTYHNWTKDGAVVSTNLSFTIAGVDRLNFGFYECIAVTEFYDGTTGTARNQTELDVQYIPEVGILTEASIVREGEMVILSCKIDSNPDVTYHNWTKDGVVLSTDLNLTIANAQRQDTGTYQCIAGTVFYDGTTGVGSNATELTVQYVPGVTVEKASLTIKEGENVTLTCEIDSTWKLLTITGRRMALLCLTTLGMLLKALDR
ncbi:B-cell receptor CD22-like [Ptychodera flava]|uniref:B-cell receptor CD22-like n=1 Tax=Ptychodera flava TaxID=63121 RepID=UPI003969ECA5